MAMTVPASNDQAARNLSMPGFGNIKCFDSSEIYKWCSVCAHWRSVVKHRLQDLNIQRNMVFTKRLPMLLVPTIDSSENLRNLYSLPNEEVYDLRLPVPYNSRCIGSCHGWLIFIDTISFVVTLFNPFYFGNRNGTIHLPPFSAVGDFCRSVKDYDVFPEYYISKAVLSADPLTSSSYILILIHGELRSLAYYKSRDETWSYVVGYPLIFDLIYVNGHFNAVNFSGELLVLDPEANIPQLEAVSEPLYGQIGPNTRRFLGLQVRASA